MNDPKQSSGTEASSALEAVLKDQAQRQERRDRPTPPPGQHGPVAHAVAALFLAATVWVLVARPDVLHPPPLPMPPPEVMSAGLRMDIYVAAIQVMDYREERGRLPSSLVDALESPEDGEGLVYETLGSGAFRVSGTRGTDRAAYVSTESLRDFLANARQVLAESRE